MTCLHVESQFDPATSVQVNMRAGRLPPPEDNGIRYLKIPMNAL